MVRRTDLLKNAGARRGVERGGDAAATARERRRLRLRRRRRDAERRRLRPGERQAARRGAPPLRATVLSPSRGDTRLRTSFREEKIRESLARFQRRVSRARVVSARVSRRKRSQREVVLVQRLNATRLAIEEFDVCRWLVESGWRLSVRGEDDRESGLEYCHSALKSALERYDPNRMYWKRYQESRGENENRSFFAGTQASWRTRCARSEAARSVSTVICVSRCCHRMVSRECFESLRAGVL